MARRRNAKPDRLSGFSDGVFAVIITLLVPVLKPQESSSFCVAPFALAAGERLRSRYVIKVDRRLANSKERAMPEEKTTADRLAAYSDAVFAVIVTIMVLELRAPDQPAFS